MKGCSAHLTTEFFRTHPVTCARDLIGATLLWGNLQGRVVETEAYAAEGDPAYHTFFRRSSRDFVLAGAPGDLYIYLNYGMYWLLNVLVKGPEGDGFVLIRAIEPKTGVPSMRRRSGPLLKEALLASGPGRLTRAFGITGRHHGKSICGLASRGFLPHENAVTVGATKRIGISRARDLEWRFIDAHSPSPSGPNKLNASARLLPPVQ